MSLSLVGDWSHSIPCVASSPRLRSSVLNCSLVVLGRGTAVLSASVPSKVGFGNSTKAQTATVVHVRVSGAGSVVGLLLQQIVLDPVEVLQILKTHTLSHLLVLLNSL